MIKLKKFLVPTIGDKIASRTGQKGTVGIIYNESDLFYNEAGLCPDLIINPNSFPKRMTINYIYEVLATLFSTLSGKKIDSTIMQGFDNRNKEPHE